MLHGDVPEMLMNKLGNAQTTLIPICAFQDSVEKRGNEAEGDNISSRCSVWYFWQARCNPGMHLSRAERSQQSQFVERPAWQHINSTGQ